MADSVVEEIIDGIVEVLEEPDLAVPANDLPEHSTVKYRRPRAILPSDCPLLVVWLQRKEPLFIETSSFNGRVSIGISWHEETVAQAAQLIDDEDLAKRLMNTMEKIERRIRGLARTGWSIEEAWEVTPGGVDYFRAGQFEEALTEGYAVEVVVRVEENS